MREVGKTVGDLALGVRKRRVRTRDKSRERADERDGIRES